MKRKSTGRTPGIADRHVGAKIRLRRETVGMSQKALGEALGVTFQQVQKYERGANRVGVGRLCDVAQALGVDTSFFLEGLLKTPVNEGKPLFGEPLNGEQGFEPTTMEALVLVREFLRVSDPRLRKSLLELVKAMPKNPSRAGQ